jgi:TPR repeat protein
MPKFGDAHFALAFSFLAKGKLAEAETEFREATVADPHHAEARFNLGLLMHDQGKHEEAAAELKAAADLDQRAMESHDIEEAKVAQLFANKGHRGAQVELATMFLVGRGVVKSELNALRWLRRAATSSASDTTTAATNKIATTSCSIATSTAAADIALEGTEGITIRTEAQYQLGVLYFEGKGTVRSGADALHWFHQAATQGHSKAMYSIGFMLHYELGVGLPFPRVENQRGDGVGEWSCGDASDAAAAAVGWFLLAAEIGDVDAMAELGRILMKGGNGGGGGVGGSAEGAEAGAGGAAEATSSTAEMWLRRAAEKGQPQAQADLAVSRPSFDHRLL